MKLESLKTVNFKRLGSREFNFSEGLNFIVGDNGQGKTTTLRAVAVAMFGIQMLPGHSDDVATWGYDRWSLELEFINGKDKYLITRSKSTASLSKNGKLEANGNTPVTKYMEDLLGMSAKDYNLLIHSRQGETAYVLTYGATALQRKVEEFSGVEVVEKVEVEAALLARTLKFQMDNMVKPEGNLEEIKSSAKAADIKKEELEALLTDLGELKAPVQPAVSVRQAQRNLQNYLDSVKDVEQYEEDKSRLTEELASVVEVSKPEDIKELQATRKSIRDSIKENNSHNDQVVRNQDRRNYLNERILKINPTPLSSEEMDEIQALVALGDVDSESNDLQSKNISLVREIQELRKQLREGKCGSCGTVLQDVDPVKLEKQAAAKSEMIKENDNRIKALTEQATAAKGKISVLQDKQIKYNQEVIQLEEMQQEYSYIRDMELNTNELLEADLELVNSQLGALTEKTESYERYLDVLSTATRRLNRLVAPTLLPKVEEASVDVIEQHWEEYQQLSTDYQNQSTRVKNILLQILAFHNKSVEMGKLQASIEKFDVEHEERNTEYETAKGLSTYLRKKRADYIRGIWDAIMYHSGDFLRRASNDWLEDVMIEDSKFFFKENGAWVPAVEASGAQASFVGAALRYGLNKSLYRGKTFLAFDEATSDMTEENSRNLTSALGGAAAQMFIITQRSTDQGLANNIIEV